ncbi:unnamed protein product [Rodentolepis nana]|uniref:Protein kinase domain-containing protein n=1 Tax=Rodentolepis nana TaxID=102285 RepID=A0A0R3T917_RODNA|nr:unnamed protein product [Rodentolepis nana]
MPEMSRINPRRYQPQMKEIPEPLHKIAILGKSEFTAGLENCWQVYEAQIQESLENCSAFVLTKIAPDKTEKLRKSEINLGVCRKEIEMLRTLQHKRILKIFAEAEENW